MQTTTQRNQLLSLIAICGELPSNQISRLSGGERYKQNMLKQLKANGQIKSFSGDDLRGYRLRLPAKEKLLHENADRFTFYLTGVSDTNHIRSEITRRLRLHRTAEAIITMLNAGVEIFRDRKTLIFSPNRTSGEMIVPAFYSSREVKEMGMEAVKINGARASGVLVTEDDIFVTYSLGDTQIDWDYRAEMRFKAMMQGVFCYDRRYSSDVLHGLLLGNRMELAANLLSRQSSGEHFIFDGSYNDFYFLTNDRHGERILSLLCNRSLRQALDDILRDDLTPPDLAIGCEHDGYDESGRPVLFAYSCNLPRIRRFLTALSLRERVGVIVCFDFQADAFRTVVGERVELQEIDFDKWEGVFFAEE